MSGLRVLAGGLYLVRPLGRRAKALLACALTGAVLIGALGPAVPSALAAPTPMVDLGQASTYAVLSGASVGNTVSAVGAPHTTLRGDLGVKANTQPTGFPPGVVTGTTQVGNAAATQAHADLVTAYTEVAGRTGGVPLAGALAGATIAPGLYTITGAASNTGTVTLDGGGDPNAVFVFQVGGALTTAASSHVVLTNGARASRVFWQVNGAAGIGAGGDFAGTLMALDAAAVGNGTLVNGRVFARNGALTLDDNDVYSAPPVLTVTGGANASTSDTTPTISGTTDVEAPGVVTVTVAGQTLTATPSGGAWSVTSAILANNTYPVVASVTDGAGNPASATQQLTVDTVLPVIAIDGGASVTTNDPTPTITGTTDAAPGTVVTVTIGGQTRTALVQADATWSVTLATLSDATRTVTASVSDPAGNVGTGSQQLIIDTVPPGLTVSGGASALTNDATAEISGTASPPGATVTVSLADQTLTALVGSGGAWSVTADALSDGPHRVVVSVSDPAGNTARFTQTLSVDTVAPAVAITGGATSSTSTLAPTITGTSNAATGTTVTVTIAGQTRTALVQGDGTWNTTPASVGEGTWTVVASAPDAAGNVGSASQTLTIATPAPTPTPTPAAAPAPAPAAPAAGDTTVFSAAPAAGPGPSGTAATTGGTSSTGGSGTPTVKAATRPTVSLAARFKAARGKSLKVPFALNGPGRVTLTVLRGTKVVATLKTTLRKAGRGSLTWTAKIERRSAPRGSYKIVIRSVSPAGASARDTAAVRIT